MERGICQIVWLNWCCRALAGLLGLAAYSRKKTQRAPADSTFAHKRQHGSLRGLAKLASLKQPLAFSRNSPAATNALR